MSSLADLIIATSSEVEAIVASEYPLGTFEGVNVDGLDPLQIAALHSALVDKEFGELLGGYQPVAEGSPSGPWLIRIPADLIAALAIISPDNQASIAGNWTTADQLQESGWSAQEAEKFLARLVRLAQVASFEEREVFLCVYD
ncbi:MAG: hypothetical protein BMS9Abin28_1044 [Anaerolineae bacterium]|nr:MAG: hypothetical protein BMS9Abin28_1044 [Anaerolineae bacterium]